MKPYANAHRSPIAKGLPPFAEFRHRSYTPDPEASSPPFMFAQMLSGGGFMQPSVKSDMLLGNLPNLEAFCQELYQTFFRLPAPYSALQFLPALKKLVPSTQAAMDRFLSAFQNQPRPLEKRPAQSGPDPLAIGYIQPYPWPCPGWLCIQGFAGKIRGKTVSA